MSKKYLVFTFPAEGELSFKFIKQVRTKREARELAKASEINGQLSVVIKSKRFFLLIDDKLI